MMFRMGQLPKFIIFLLIIVLTTTQAALAEPVTAELAERTPSLDKNGQFIIPPTATTTTTTTTIPEIQRCTEDITGATTVGSDSGYNYWSFAVNDICPPELGDPTSIFCFENPYVDLQLPNVSDEIVSRTEEFVGMTGLPVSMETWQEFMVDIERLMPRHKEDCFLCACYRVIGCFPPGVKITMADGSLRNIENVRAGDLVRSAKTGAPVKVRQVIEGPEALPLIRFGFEDTTVTTSQAHPVLTAAGLKPASELKKGDTVFDAQSNPHTLTVLETLPLEDGQRVINVNLDAAPSDTDGRLIVSDGIITGDIVLQARLKERR